MNYDSIREPFSFSSRDRLVQAAGMTRCGRAENQKDFPISERHLEQLLVSLTCTQTKTRNLVLDGYILADENKRSLECRGLPFSRTPPTDLFIHSLVILYICND